MAIGRRPAGGVAAGRFGAIALNPGDKAPAIMLSDQSGTTVKLSDLKGRKVLVFFYPKADT